ncbi:MAG: hypothetical protein WBF56_03445 [Candidatus Acidiferrales bacterium]
MKIKTLIGPAALLLVLGIAAPAFAQDQHDQPDPAAKAQDARPATADQPKQQAEPPKTPSDQPHPGTKEAVPPKKEAPRPAQPKTTKPSNQAQQNSGHKQDVNRSSSEQASRGRIPDDKFKAHFGSEHRFHVGHPTIVSGHPRFQYGGYSFVMVQPWPAGWGYDDNVYIMDVNGVYYLVDAVHPGVQLELSVVM